MSIGNNGKNYLAKQAVVIGGSIAGLVAARVLADYFQKVTVIERDLSHAVGHFTPREGVPQGQQGHILLRRGVNILQRFFPNLEQTLQNRGAHKIDVTDQQFNLHGQWTPKFKSGKEGFLQSRPLLEDSIRLLVQNFPSITFLYGHEARGLLHDAHRHRLIGVKAFNLENQQTADIGAHLVVDASGRNSHCPKWLAALGYASPPVSEIKINLCYMTRLYRVPENHIADWQVLFIHPHFPKRNKGGGIATIENDSGGKRWLVSVYEQHHEGYCEGMGTDFLYHIEQLGDSYLTQLIKQATPLTPCISYRLPTARRYAYEKLLSLPTGFIALGDAVCSFNPIYGQGMSVAAMAAEMLAKLLSTPSKNWLDYLQKNYFARLRKLLDVPWYLAAYQDLLYPQAQGSLWGINLMNRYKSRLINASQKDPLIWMKLFEVMSLEKHPLSILSPSLLWSAVFKHYS